jgi:hypothetical protein
MRQLRTLARWLFNVVAVPVLLFEAWGLQPLLALVNRLARWRVWAMLEQRITDLPPYGALSLFVLPTLALIPVKIVALYLLTTGMKLYGASVLVLAKLIGTVIVARIFQLTRKQLLRIPWFARAYAVFERWRDQVFERLHQTAVYRVSKRMTRVIRARAGRVTGRIRRWVKGWNRDDGAAP